MVVSLVLTGARLERPYVLLGSVYREEDAMVRHMVILLSLDYHVIIAFDLFYILL